MRKVTMTIRLGVIADDAVVHYVVDAESAAPVFAILGKAVAQHDNLGGVGQRLPVKLPDPL